MRLDEGMARRPLDGLRESDENPRAISTERLEALKHALRADPAMMEARPIIATPEGEVVCGNMRLRALRELGVRDAPIYVAELSPTRKREWMLRDNQEYGDWVPDELARLVAAHADDDADLSLLGFTNSATDDLISLARKLDGDEPEPPPDTGATVEVWGVVIECESEEQQAELVEELAERGLAVRALIPV